MSVELISVGMLVVVFLVATVFHVHMGALALVATFVVGVGLAGQSESEVLQGFPAELFVVLVGVTYLFAIAKANGTIDWLVDAAVAAVHGRVWAFPWIMFLISAALAGMGAVPPAAVAIIAPTAMRIAHRYNISPLLMGLMVANGVSAGEFSPIGVFGLIVNDIAVQNSIESSPARLFICTFLVNAIICYLLYLFIHRRGQRALGRGEAQAGAVPEPTPDAVGGYLRDKVTSTTKTSTQLSGTRTAVRERALTPQVALTLTGISAMVVAVTVLELDIGFVALTIAILLSIVSPAGSKEALTQIAWPTVFLIVGIVTYVNLLQEIGTITYVSDAVAHLQSPLLVALLICVIAATVSAFASTTGILGALIPLAVPFLVAGEVSSVAMLIALCLSSSLVDASPFSTTGALVVANTADEDRDRTLSNLMRWGMSMIVIAPIASWALFVLPGW
ncbi:SLC13 family permease [Rhodococcus sp. NPDC057529]|uniref:SLC13 family permease n=1 Tax=Rhodococcus sp. NPDC057529 TaxID=3346158 RepID=UPI0036733FDB